MFILNNSCILFKVWNTQAFRTFKRHFSDEMNAPKVVLPFVASVHPVVDVLFKRFSSVWVLSNETLGTVKTWRRWLSILIRFSPQVVVKIAFLVMLYSFFFAFFFYLWLISSFFKCHESYKPFQESISLTDTHNNKKYKSANLLTPLTCNQSLCWKCMCPRVCRRSLYCKMSWLNQSAGSYCSIKYTGTSVGE